MTSASRKITFAPAGFGVISNDPLPADQRGEAMTEASKWQPRIGEQVVITSSKSWASDWVDAAGQPLVLWVAGMTALTDGIDVTLSEEWPLPTRLFGQGHLTDGFIIARSGDQDDIAPLSPPTNGEVSEPPLSSEYGLDAGVGHAPDSGSREGSETLLDRR